MKTLLSLSAAVIALVGLATADPRDYVNVTGDVVIDCHPELSADQGGSCFAAGHISPDGSGLATVTINDNSLNPASGFWCQDLDGDGSCDDATEEPFCQSLTFQAGAKWDPGQPLFIFGDGPVFGNAALSVCGSTSVATVGNVNHS